jgi:hypothetical protein
MTTQPVTLYQVGGREFLDRRHRASVIVDRITSGEPFSRDDVLRDWQAIANEIPEIPYEVDRRYRIRVVAGAPAVRHVHLQSQDTGELYALNVPVETNPQYQELEVTFLSRAARLAGGGSTAVFALPDGDLAMLADLDVLRVDQLP